jgi:thioesterase domain-containing protein
MTPITAETIRPGPITTSHVWLRCDATLRNRVAPCLTGCRFSRRRWLTARMSPDELTEYLHASIPMCAALGVAVVEAGPRRVVLGAPHGPNVNHQGTLFGGSLASVAITAGFAVLVLALHDESMPQRVVIQRHEYRYILPGRSDFEAEASIERVAWDRLVDSVGRRGVGRIEIGSAVSCVGELIGESTGWFVALPPDEATAPVF